MRLYLSLSDGFCALTTERPDIAFMAAGVFFPAAHDPEKNPGGFAARPPLLILRFPRLPKADAKWVLAQSYLAAIERTMGRLPLRLSRNHRKHLTRGGGVGALFLVCALAGNASHPSMDSSKKSAYPGYEFSQPFPLRTFLEERVPETLPYAQASPLEFASAPHFSFLRAPRMEAQAEALFMVVQGGDLPKVNAITSDDRGHALSAILPFTHCDSVIVYAVEPAAVLWLAWPGSDRDRSLRFVSAPLEPRTACDRAQLFSEDKQ